MILFVMPGSDDPQGNTLNSGIDLQFCVDRRLPPTRKLPTRCWNFLLQDDVIQQYITDQKLHSLQRGRF